MADMHNWEHSDASSDGSLQPFNLRALLAALQAGLLQHPVLTGWRRR